MRVPFFGFLLLGLALGASPAPAQRDQAVAPEPASAEFKIYASHPRLWLEADRLRRLRRDVERESERWRQLRLLDQQGAPFPEEALLRALLYQVAGDEQAGRKAIAWGLAQANSSGGLRDPAKLRLGAVVFDWCYPLLSQSEREPLAAALATGVQSITRQSALDLAGVRSALLAAIAVAGDWPGSAAALEDLLARGWQREILPKLLRGELTQRGADLVALLEICHATRNNLETDLWQQAHEVFKPLPLVLMLGYYPQPVSSPEGLLRQPASPSTIELDVQVEGPLRRIGEMMLVAYENRLQEFQLLQGWLRHDSYTLKGPLGAVYEFLWLNPYLPGLSFFSAPPLVHDKLGGRVFARAGWQEEDLWAGYLQGEFQIFAEGQRMVIDPGAKQAPLVFPGAAMIFGALPMKFEVKIPPVVDHTKVPYNKAIYVTGLGEGQSYEVRVNKERFTTYRAGRGGVLVLENRPETGKSTIDFDEKIRVRIRSR